MNKLLPKVALFLCLGLFFIIGCSNSQNTSQNQADNQEKTSQGKNVVIINNFSFDKPKISIKKGESITWVNKDQAAHTATGKDFDTGKIETGSEHKITFQTSGTFDYICNYHPSMKGQVTVTD